MKVFVVNVNNCLNFAQYEPFFYEHIYKKQLVLLDEIKDTCELNVTYEQIYSLLNQHPFTIDEGAVFIFISRDFSKVLQAHDYELYNDINVYIHLTRKLSKKFRVYTFYIDKTNALEASDAIYQQLNMVSEKMVAPSESLKQFFLDPPQQSNQSGNYKYFLAEKIKKLLSASREFYESVLLEMPDGDGDSIAFQNGINHYVSKCKTTLSQIKHSYAHIVRNDISEDIRVKLKVVYYIKHLADGDIALKDTPDFESFPAPDYEYIKRLLATYRSRLSIWYHSSCPISSKGACSVWNFTQNTIADMDYNGEVNSIVAKQLNNLNLECNGDKSVVDTVFEKLDDIVSEAREKLELFAHKQTKDIFNPENYKEDGTEEFLLNDPIIEDELAEKKQLSVMNNHHIYNLPDFSDENRLAQDLEIINGQITQIYQRIKAYNKKSFLVTFIVSLCVVAVLYLWAQSSVFIKEHSWIIFAGYLFVTAFGFSWGYSLVKKKYFKQVSALLVESKQLVENYLQNFKEIAKDFESNLLEFRKYFCLMKKLEEKEELRKNYQENMSRYLWHMKKVNEILSNLEFFNYFIGDAKSYEDKVTLESFEHDSVHTEFYHLKLF